MKTTEAVILLVLGASLAYGLYKGLIGQLSSLAGIIVGILLTRILASPVASLLSAVMPSTFSNSTVALVTAVILVFAIAFFATFFVARIARKLTRFLMVEWLDRLLGAIFSMFKWTLVLSIVLNIWLVVAPYSGAFRSPALLGDEIFSAIMHLAPDILGVATEKIGDLIPNML